MRAPRSSSSSLIPHDDALAQVLQAVIARKFLKEDPRVVLLSLSGFKPVYDAYRIVCDVPQAVGQAFDQDFTFAMTRISETVGESLFQSSVQAIAFAGAEQRNFRQIVSLGMSCLSVANTFMGVAHDTDTNANRRTIDPSLFGFIPDGPQGNLVCIFLFLVGGSYFASKLIAIGVLGGASLLGLGVYLGAESVLLLLPRMAIGNWRWYTKAGESTGFSLLFHFAAAYPILSAVPFPIARLPQFATPSVYAGFTIWTVIVSNSLMVVLAFVVFDYAVRGPPTAPTTCDCTRRVHGGYAAFNGDHHGGDAAPRTGGPSTSTTRLSTHPREYIWNEATAVNARGQLLVDCSQRGSAPM